ncbi:MAG TPA: lipase family protein [Vicinamibacterales bacterium]|nr:lipase family protein [Vicinamibacterales bacterium]
MTLERTLGGACDSPFPVYAQVADDLAAAHRADTGERDGTVAHVLATCAAYAYSDADTVATMMSRLGLEANACVRITQTVDAMFIFSTAYLVQSRCGRVVILCYRGTEPATVGNWLGDAEVSSESSTMSLEGGAPAFRVHAGFHRNVRATWWTVLRELTLALQGRSLVRPDETVESPLEALYVTGHSLGGAMAVLFALKLAAAREHGALAATLRAVYTFGQPMAVGGALPPVADDVGRRLFRHITSRDLTPALPPAAWGAFTHFGKEYRHTSGVWQRSEVPVAQLVRTREIPRSLLAFFATNTRRASYAYSLADHGPQHYLAALRPSGLVTEFGD